MSSVPSEISDDIAMHLEGIAKHFKDPKITLLVRSEIPGKDADFVMTSDTLPEAIAALRHRDKGKIASAG